MKVIVLLLVFMLPTITALGVGILDLWQMQEEAFKAEVDEISRYFDDVKQDVFFSLNALSISYQSLAGHDSARLTALTNSLISNNNYIDLAVYSSWVKLSQQDAFVANMHDEGFPTYAIKKHLAYRFGDNEEGNFPVHFVEPYVPKMLKLLGDDLVRNQSDVQLFEDLILNKNVAVLNGWSLSPVNDSHIYMAKPVFRGFFDPQSQQERLQQTQGIFLFGLNVDTVLATLKQRFPDIRVIDSDAFDEQIKHQENKSLQHFWSELLTLNADMHLFDGEMRLRLNKSVEDKALLTPLVVAAAIASGLLSLSIWLLMVKRRESQQKLLCAEQALQDERLRAYNTLHSISDAVLVTDTHGSIQYANPVAVAWLGVASEKISGMMMVEILRFFNCNNQKPLEDTETYIKRLSSGIAMEDVLLTTASEGLVPVHNRVSFLNDVEDDGLVLVMRDVRHEHELSKRLTYQATHDALTGLINRAEFETRVKELLLNTNQQQQTNSLLFVDLDRFKLVNDTCGHIAGDELLKTVSELFASGLRDCDLLARMGGDEFAILLNGQDESEAMKVAERLRAGLHGLRFLWKGGVYDITGSFGVLPISANNGTFEDLMAYADLACHAAKEAGRNAIHLYKLNDEIVDHHRSQMQWRTRLQTALEKDEFVLYHQPMFAFKTEAKPAVLHEVLIRLRTDNGVDILPGLFLPAAERYDLMPSIDRWVIAKTLQLMNQSLSLPNNAICTINLSGQSLADESLYRWIRMQCGKYGIAAQRVCFEITETVAVSNMASASRLLNELRAEGYRILLDDFGSGMSSFGYLNQLKVDFIKIDGQFVRDASKDRLAAAMVSMICNIADVLEIQTVAEMVESEESAQQMAEMGVDYAQGFHIAKPSQILEK